MYRTVNVSFTGHQAPRVQAGSALLTSTQVQAPLSSGSVVVVTEWTHNLETKIIKREVILCYSCPVSFFSDPDPDFWLGPSQGIQQALKELGCRTYLKSLSGEQVVDEWMEHGHSDPQCLESPFVKILAPWLFFLMLFHHL